MSGFAKRTGLLVAVALIIAAPFLTAAWMDAALVHDPHGIVEKAFIEESFRHKPMRYVGVDWHYASVEGDGTIVVECRDGETLRGGYVTNHGGETITVAPDCTLQPA